MKNYNYFVLLILSLIIVHGSNAEKIGNFCNEYLGNSSGSMKKFKGIKIKALNITDPEHKKLVCEAVDANSPFILHFESDPYLWGNPYPSHVLRAAKDIAEKANGKGSKVYIILERMLSYK